MSRVLSIVAAQVRPVPFDVEATLAKLESEVRTVTAAFGRCDLLLFPELYLAAEDPFTPRESPRYMHRVAEPVPGPLTERIGKLAQRARRWIVAGSIYERAGDDVFNTALAFSPDGELAARHRKIFPWKPWEATSSGAATTTFDMPGYGRAGLMICYDGWFPEVARGCARAGAEVILQPTLTTTVDRAQELVLARANAIANQCYVVNVNAAASIGGGRSIAVDPEGRVLFEGGAGEELITEVLDLDRVTQVREHGTQGLNRLLAHLDEAPATFWDDHRRRLPG